VIALLGARSPAPLGVARIRGVFLHSVRIDRSGPEEPMEAHRVFKMSFAGVYPHYVRKAVRKGRKKKEVDEVICWLTGYSPGRLAQQIKRKKDFEAFFREAPALHPNADKITGTICGVRIEEIDDPLMRNIRYLDKLVDELAKGRPMEKILRGSDAVVGERSESRGPKTRSRKE
jgi:hypothetical protein